MNGVASRLCLQVAPRYDGAVGSGGEKRVPHFVRNDKALGGVESQSFVVGSAGLRPGGTAETAVST